MSQEAQYQPIELPAASAPDMNVLKVEEFRGIDLTNAPNNVSLARSPWAPNMIRDSVGKVRKWQGWRTVKTYEGKINGVHILETQAGEVRIVHAGTKMWLDGEQPTEIYSDMADDVKSVSQQMAGKLYILDGKTYTVFDGETMRPVAEVSPIPTTVIGRAPNGGGQSHDPVNLLQAKRTNSFLGTATTKDYVLDFAPLDATAVTAQVKNASNNWEDKTEGTHFTVNRTTGTVTFTTAPGVPPITGEDNVRITAAKTVEGYADRVNGCRNSELYGVSGMEDRIFMTGNPAYPNLDWYSEFEDPTYMADIYYSMLGQDDSAVLCYAKINNNLAAIKNNAATDTNIIVRQGKLSEEGKAMFTQVASYQANGAVSAHTLRYIANEPVFFSEEGIMAVTPTDVTGERTAALRSHYINGNTGGERGLLNEANKNEAVACVHNGLYMLAVGGKIYALDSTQFSSTNQAPFSHRQYEGFVRLNVPARVIWSEGDKLCFGTEDGRICEFYTNLESSVSYNDDGEAYECYWLTPEFSGKTFYAQKTFSYVAARIAAMSVTGIRISARFDDCERDIDEEYEILLDYNGDARYFSYTNLQYSKLTYSTYAMPRTLGDKAYVKKVDKVQFRLENSQINEAFGLYSFTSEYIESGKYKA